MKKFLQLGQESKKGRNSYLFFNNGIQQNYDKTQILNFFKKWNFKLRIRFAISRNRINYLNSFNLVDINLDTFPIMGEQILSQLLWELLFLL